MSERSNASMAAAAGLPLLRALAAATACVLASLAALLLAPAARADFDFCPPGAGPGQCGVAVDLNSLRGLSLDYETGLLYVADRPNDRVEVFEEDGTFVESFGGFTDPTDVAIDNVPGSASRHDVYVVDQGARRIEKFHRGASEWELVWSKGEAGGAEGQFERTISVGVGPGGMVYALDNIYQHESPEGPVYTHRLQRLDPATGEPVPSQCLLGERGLALDLAVASDGSFWVSNYLTGTGVRKYSAPGGCAELVFKDGDMAASRTLALDESDRVFIGQGEVGVRGGFFQVLTVRNAAGEALRRFGYGRLTPWNPEGLAVHTGGEGGIFLAFGEKVAKAAGIRRLNPLLPPPGPITAPPSLEVGGVGPTRAAVSAEVNPEGAATEVSFEYLSREDYEAQGNSFTGGATEATPVQTITPASGTEFRLHGAEGLIGCPDPATEVEEAGSSCLLPETEYLWRVMAVNGDGAGEGTAEGETFTTPGSLEIESIFSTEVGTDTARLGVEADTHEVPAHGYFEYVTEAQFGASGFAAAAKAPDVDAGQAPLELGAADGVVSRSIAVYPLATDTAYRYRFIATNKLIEPKEVESGSGSFETSAGPDIGPCANEAERIGAAALLPDCRAYEMVSPVNKEGGDIRVLTDNFGQLTVLEQAAASGERLAYGSARSFGGAVSAPYTSQYIARRIAGSEWSSHPINVARGRPLVGAPAQFRPEFKAFSADLCQGWVGTFAEIPSPPPGFEPGVRNLLRRDDGLCGPETLTALAPRTTPEGIPSGAEFLIELQGVSADGAHAIFTANTKLAAGGSEDTFQLYESIGGGAPRLVCYLPSGAAAGGSCTAGTSVPNGSARLQPGTISTDGGRVFFSTGGAGARPLYVRSHGERAESARVHGAAAGTGTAIGPASGKGFVRSTGAVINLEDLSGGFAPGQEVSDSAGKIAPGTTIESCSPDCIAPTALTLSQAPSGNALNDVLTGHPSATVNDVSTASGAFQAGQTVEGPGIPRGAQIESCAPECGAAATALTLSAEATKTAIGAQVGAFSPCTEAAAKACTTPVSEAAEVSEGIEGATFWGASGDGSVAVFSLGNLAAETVTPATLHAFDVDAEADTQIAGRVRGVLGMSADASRIYFASAEALGGQNSEGDEAIEGQPNLYLYAAGAGVSFVATLDEDDVVAAVSDDRYGKHVGYVTAGGMHAVFASLAGLTGYDNRQSGSAINCGAVTGEGEPGEPCREVYRYAAGSGELSCVSCNPTGSRPAGPSTIPFFQSRLHATRVISTDGARVYFQSADRLNARDTNGRVDVYQWEQAGTGGCETSSYDYSSRDEGCVSLISSGQGALDARLVESDPSGDNVFFATGSGLLPQDPGGFDIYDARVGGGLPIPQEPAPSCEGEACQSPPPAPDNPTPGSSAFHGAGNVSADPAARCRGAARRAGRLSRQAKRLRHGARGLAHRNPRRSRALRHKAARYARGAHRQSKRARRCRARVRRAHR